MRLAVSLLLRTPRSSYIGGAKLLLHRGLRDEETLGYLGVV
jgi:hypothetical protein